MGPGLTRHAVKHETTQTRASTGSGYEAMQRFPPMFLRQASGAVSGIGK